MDNCSQREKTRLTDIDLPLFQQVTGTAMALMDLLYDVCVFRIKRK